MNLFQPVNPSLYPIVEILVKRTMQGKLDSSEQNLTATINGESRRAIDKSVNTTVAVDTRLDARSSTAFLNLNDPRECARVARYEQRTKKSCLQ